jgi:glycosyltransferase involved in cell wall biosynthesis
MRILRVITSLDPSKGGPSAGVRAITPVLADMGHTTEIACLDQANAPFLRDTPCEVHPIGPGRSSYHWTPRLRPWLVENADRFDAVVVHGLWQLPGLATRAALRGRSTPYVVYPHGMLDPWFKRRYPLKHLKKWLYWPWGEYRVLRDAEMVLFTSEEERLQARKSFWLYRCRDAVVSYGTSAPPDHAEEQRSAFFGKYPALSGRPFLLFLSRIHEKKGCDLLIRAFAESQQQRTGIGDLVVAGPCADSAYLDALRDLARRVGLPVSDSDAGTTQSLAAERSGSKSTLHFLPMLTGELKWGAFRAASAFILPSHQENFGIAVAEALSCGTPVLISNKVNIWREIQDDGAGLVESDDLDGTFRLLSRWDALEAERREEMRGNASSCFQKRFEIREAARHLTHLLGKVVQ